ncbi:MAG: DUF1566 domain-containing protein [Proteobacteria bacterium]|nr:DUF1566 domain-containing protein [Pseudomonadota bacterium]MBU1717014.1 DUF1566 domain-containing protein [Pseudomonadota bacterium]
MKKTLFLLAALSLLPGAPALAGSFTDHGDATVTDGATGLMWQQTEGGAMDWESALAYCEGLTLSAYSDWRLPNHKELESLTDDSRFYPAIDQAFFPGVGASCYWSSTSYASYTALAWSVLFYLGHVSYYNKADSYYVRCVR